MSAYYAFIDYYDTFDKDYFLRRIDADAAGSRCRRRC